MKKAAVLAGIALIAAYFGGVESGLIPQRQIESTDDRSAAGGADRTLTAAFENRQSGVQVQSNGEVTRVLPDDNDGSRHQRFIVQVAPGQTVLIAHNIDLADRVADLKVGDRVEFNGEYEWNARGGVVHWTHRDPRGSHVAGWIKHDGRMYQ